MTRAVGEIWCWRAKHWPALWFVRHTTFPCMISRSPGRNLKITVMVVAHKKGSEPKHMLYHSLNIVPTVKWLFCLTQSLNVLYSIQMSMRRSFWQWESRKCWFSLSYLSMVEHCCAVFLMNTQNAQKELRSDYSFLCHPVSSLWRCCEWHLQRFHTACLLKNYNSRQCLQKFKQCLGSAFAATFIHRCLLVGVIK